MIRIYGNANNKIAKFNFFDFKSVSKPSLAYIRLSRIPIYIRSWLFFLKKWNVCSIYNLGKNGKYSFFCC